MKPAGLMLKPTPHAGQTADEEGAQSLSLRSLFDAEEQSLVRYAFTLVGRRAVAEEIVQDVFLQLHVRWDEVQSPREWLYRSVRNRAYNYIRDNRRRTRHIDQYRTEPPGESEDSPDAALQRLEAIAELRKIVDQLGAEDRQLVTLKYFEGLKYRDISQRTGLSVSNVGYRLHHILNGLADRLRPLGIEEDQ